MRKVLLSLALSLGLCAQAFAADNYSATAGSGLTFGAKDAAGVLYSRFIGCDNTTVSQCWTVNASGQLVVSVANTNANGQAAAASSSPVVVAKNSGTGSTVAGAAVGTAGTPSAEVVSVQNPAADPCQTIANSTARINIGSATTTRIITPSASNKTYICSVDLFAFEANNVAIVEGTGGTCGTGTAGVVGGTTTSTGISFPAQGGLAKGGAGFFVWNTAGTNVDFCLITSTTGPLTGFVKYVQAP